MTKTNTNKNNQKNRTDTRKRMSTAAILLSAIAFISSSALTSVHSINVFAATPTNSSSNITSINYKQGDRMEKIPQIRSRFTNPGNSSWSGLDSFGI